MDAFVRRLAALSAAWSLCELIMPEGGQRRLARMAAGALVMLTLISSAFELLGGDIEAMPAMSALSPAEPDEGAYAAAALRSLANQVEGLSVRLARRAGYDASAVAYICRDGSLSHIELALSRRADVEPLIGEREVAQRLAELFETDEGNIRLTDGAIAR